MQFLTSWRDSLLLLKPENAKLFSLVTLNACLYAYRTIVRFCLPLLLCLIISVAYTGTRWFLVPVLSLFVCLFSFYCAARPSTLRKNCSYFLGYGKHLIWFSLFFIGWLVALCAISFLGVPCWFPQLPLYAPLLPVFSITVAFLCDSDGSFKQACCSFCRGLLFVLYNLPICALLAALFIGVAQLLFMVMPAIVAEILLIMLWPVVLCTYINVYIKRVHEQFFVYFANHE